MPTSNLISDPSGNLFGTSTDGGAYGKGDIFAVGSHGGFEVLYSFTGDADGGGPSGPLLRDNAGNLYGAAAGGGDLSGCRGQGCGTIFRLDTSLRLTVLANFTDGAGLAINPYGSLLPSRGGTALFGIAGGGLPNCFFSDPCGTVFELTQTGLSTVFSFGGTTPVGGLIQDTAGNLYGNSTCYNFCSGIVFELSPLVTANLSTP